MVLLPDFKKRGTKALEASIARIRIWLEQHFPERQVYIRSGGYVQFFCLPPMLQAIVAALSLPCLGWIAFATVNVVFKDQVILEKDRRYLSTQSVYENRIADLQIANAELNRALTTIETRFEAAASEVRTKQVTIETFLDRKRRVDFVLKKLADSSGSGSQSAPPTRTGSVDFRDASSVPYYSDLESNSPTQSTTGDSARAPAHIAHGTHALGYLGSALGWFIGALFPSADSTRANIPSDFYKNYPELRKLVAETNRVKHIGDGDAELLRRAQEQVVAGVSEVRAVIGRTGIDPEAYVQRTVGAEGGPDVSLEDVHIAGVSDVRFVNAYLRASASLGQLDEFLNAMRHMPLSAPVRGPQFDRTSGFGPRHDPFTGLLAFHPGLDFSGPVGSLVRATAPGHVVFAGPRGTYGNMVEIDHGFGFHTRYAHLEAVLVKVGDHVALGSPVGKLGSTGRSTGPHVHYEVWFDDVVRNPKNFLDAIPR